MGETSPLRYLYLFMFTLTKALRVFSDQRGNNDKQIGSRRVNNLMKKAEG